MAVATSLGVRELNPYNYATNNPTNGVDFTGDDTTGEAIDNMGVRQATQGRPLAAAGTAVLRATWDVFGAESTSKVADNLINGRDDMYASDYVWAGVEIATAVIPMASKSAKAVAGMRGANAAGKTEKGVQTGRALAKGTNAANKATKTGKGGKGYLQAAKDRLDDVAQQGKKAWNCLVHGCFAAGTLVETTSGLRSGSDRASRAWRRGLDSRPCLRGGGLP